MSNLDQYSRKPKVASGNASGRRFVPPTTAICVLFGGFLVQFGAGFFAFGMIFWWVFGAQTDLTSWYRFSGETTRAKCVVTAIEDTGISEGGSDDSPGTPVYRIKYEFRQGDALYAGACYTTGMQHAVGAGAEVEYPSNDPAYSRIVGTRKSALDAWVLFVAIFPLVGLALMAGGLRFNARSLRLLKRGKQTRGKLVDKQPTNTKINNQMVYKFTFEFTDEAGITHRVSDRTHHSHLVEDEETERLFYDPSIPGEGRLVDLLPGRPRVEPDGSIGWANPVAALLRALLPVGGIAAHVGVGLYLYVI